MSNECVNKINNAGRERREGRGLKKRERERERDFMVIIPNLWHLI